MEFERLADLDELVLRCRTADAKEHLREAVASYRAGGYRATIVMTWIAVVYDFVDKLRELTLAGDKPASELLRSFESIQEAHQNNEPKALQRSLDFERDLLSHATYRLELFSRNELMDMERLREDRHRCAHPSMNTPEEPYRPTAELARLHLRNAIVHALQRPPAQGRAAFALLARELDSTFFPTDLGEAQTVLAAGPLARPRRNLVNQAIIYCVDSVLKTGNKPADRDRYITALVAMSALHHDVALDALKKKMDASFSSVDPERFRFALGIVALVEGVWDSLAASSKSKCRSFVKADADVIAQRYLPSLCDVDELDECLKNVSGEWKSMI